MSVVTSCTAGDLIFWRFETGQPYLRFNVNNPTHQLPVIYNAKIVRTKTESELTGGTTVEAKKNMNSGNALEGRSESLKKLLFLKVCLRLLFVFADLLVVSHPL